MNILEVTNRTPDFMNQLLSVWESSVRATHLFLSNDDRPGDFTNTWAFVFTKGQTLTNRENLIRFYI